MSNFLAEAVLAHMPIGPDGQIIIGWREDREASEQAAESVDRPVWGDPEPQAAKYAVATIRALTKDYPDDAVMPMSILTALANELEAEHS